MSERPDDHPLIAEWLRAVPGPRTFADERWVHVAWPTNGDPGGCTVRVYTPLLGEQSFDAATVREGMDAAFAYVTDPVRGAVRGAVRVEASQCVGDRHFGAVFDCNPPVCSGCGKELA